MALAVAQVGGNVTTATNTISFTFGSSTTSGSGIGAIGHYYNTGGVSQAGDCTDNKSNTYQLGASSLGGISAPGITFYYNTISSASRGASHQVTINQLNSGGESINAAGIEVTGQDGTTSTSAYDSAVAATSTDSATPFDVTAAAAFQSGAMGIYGSTID